MSQPATRYRKSSQNLHSSPLSPKAIPLVPYAHRPLSVHSHGLSPGLQGALCGVVQASRSLGQADKHTSIQVSGCRRDEENISSSLCTEKAGERRRSPKPTNPLRRDLGAIVEELQVAKGVKERGPSTLVSDAQTPFSLPKRLPVLGSPLCSLPEGDGRGVEKVTKHLLSSHLFFFPFLPSAYSRQAVNPFPFLVTVLSLLTSLWLPPHTHTL